MFIQDLFEDSSFGLELDKIKEKIAKIYNQLVEKAYKLENPGATPEDIELFLQENGLEFKEPEVDFDSEVDEIQQMLDEMIQHEEELDPVKDKSYSNPTVETGKELKSKIHSKGNTPTTIKEADHTGLMSTPGDLKKLVKTKKVEIQTGKINKKQSIAKRISFAPLVEVVNDELASLKQRRRIGRKMAEDRL